MTRSRPPLLVLLGLAALSPLIHLIGVIFFSAGLISSAAERWAPRQVPGDDYIKKQDFGPGGNLRRQDSYDHRHWNLVGHAGEVDGITRTRDVLGNVTQLQTTWGLTQLRYDSLSRLRRVERPDGAVLTYEYRAEGPLARRRLTCGSAQSCVESDRIYIYDGLLLLEEYERQGSGPPRLWARYYYAEEGDIPLGGDFWDPQTHTYARRYFIVDRQGSVVGQIDGLGNWVERVRYDVYGRAQYRSADAVGPAVAQVLGTADGGLTLVFTEPSFPQIIGTAGPGLATTFAQTADALVVLEDDLGDPIPCTVRSEPNHPGAPAGSAYRVTPGTPLAPGQSYALILVANTLVDASNQGNAALNLAVTYQLNTTLYTGPALGSTATHPTGRSVTTNSLAFQAHYYDADADLYLMRARVYDPNTGSFLQQDPAGYQDSTNLYVGFRHDPVNLRDPTGMDTGFGADQLIIKELLWRLVRKLDLLGLPVQMLRLALLEAETISFQGSEGGYNLMLRHLILPFSTRTLINRFLSGVDNRLLSSAEFSTLIHEATHASLQRLKRRSPEFNRVFNIAIARYEEKASKGLKTTNPTRVAEEAAASVIADRVSYMASARALLADDELTAKQREQLRIMTLNDLRSAFARRIYGYQGYGIFLQKQIYTDIPMSNEFCGNLFLYLLFGVDSEVNNIDNEGRLR